MSIMQRFFLEDLMDQPTVDVGLACKNSGAILLSNVSYKSVTDFIKAIDLPEDDLGNKALINQLYKMEEADIPPPKILLYNQKSSGSPQWFDALSPEDKKFVTTPYDVAGTKINLPKRAMNFVGNVYRVNSVHLGNSDDEKLFLTKEQRDVVSQGKINTPVDHDYIASEERDFVGLKIYFFAVSQRRAEGVITPPKLIHGHTPTLGYTLSFPRSDKLRGKTPGEIRALIKTTRHSYMLNAVHSRNKELLHYEDMDDE